MVLNCRGSWVTTTLEQSSQSRENNFNFIRFVLASLVVLAHSFALPGFGRYEPIYLLSHHQIDGGALAVDIFFIISGFLVMSSWQHSKSTVDYFRKRILRIHPGFIANVLICALVIGPIGTVNTTDYFHALHPLRFVYNTIQLKLELPLTFGNLKYNSVNGSLWTIRNEFLCYVMIAMFGILKLYKLRALFPLMLLSMLSLLSVQNYHSGPLFHVRILPIVGELEMWPHYLAEYLSGVCFYLYRDRIPFSRNWAAYSGIVIATCCLFGRGLQVMIPLAGAYLVFYCSFSKALKMQRFGTKQDLSYGIYLYAFPIQQMCLYWINPVLNPAWLFLIAYPFTLLMALGSWRLVEQPFILLKSRQNKLAPAIQV